jgi:hypothetical protein
MKLLKLTAVFTVATLLITSCTKEKSAERPKQQQNNNNPVGNSAGLPSDADGAFYSIFTRTYEDHNTPDVLDDSYSATAWVGNATQTKDAGDIEVNDYKLDIGPAAGVNWYFGFGEPYFDNGDAAKWDVAGNTTTGIAAFSYTDNTPFPKDAYFTLPALVDPNIDLTISTTPLTATNILAIIYTLSGDLSEKAYSVVGSGTNRYTFKSADIKEVATAGTAIAVTVMPVAYATSVIGGKKYYFVKQFQHQRETDLK